MSQITLTLPADTLSSARALAAQTNRRVEEVIEEWVANGANSVPLNILSDEQILALADQTMSHQEQERLSALLDKNRENSLRASEKVELDELMLIYRQGLIRKAEAIKIAVQRGIKPLIS